MAFTTENKNNAAILFSQPETCQVMWRPIENNNVNVHYTQYIVGISQYQSRRGEVLCCGSISYNTLLWEDQGLTNKG